MAAVAALCTFADHCASRAKITRGALAPPGRRIGPSSHYPSAPSDHPRSAGTLAENSDILAVPGGPFYRRATRLEANHKKAAHCAAFATVRDPWAHAAERATLHSLSRTGGGQMSGHLRVGPVGWSHAHFREIPKTFFRWQKYNRWRENRSLYMARQTALIVDNACNASCSTPSARSTAWPFLSGLPCARKAVFCWSPSSRHGCASSGPRSHGTRRDPGHRLHAQGPGRFIRFLDNGRVCLSNNAAERALRGILGRKAWLFAGSNRGAERAVILYSLIGTMARGRSRLHGGRPADPTPRTPALGLARDAGA